MTRSPQENPLALPLTGPERSARALRFAHDAMATTFEIIALYADARYARQASMEAFRELDRLERELSHFIPHSDVSRIGQAQPGERVVVGDATWECLQLAAGVHVQAGGAFDVTVGPLMDAWRPRRGSSDEPSPEALAAARERTGMGLLAFDVERRAVAPRVAGMRLDLGAVGKGYALDRMAALLRQWEVVPALLHSGQSTVLAVGAPPGQPGWTLSLRDPTGREAALGEVLLADRALSGSGVELHGRHILDPRTGRPAARKAGTWALAPTAAEADALSTAFMVMSLEEVAAFAAARPDVAAMVALGRAGRLERRTFNAGFPSPG